MNNKISKIGMLSALALSCTLTMGARDIVQRTAHYMPEGNAFVCVNGNNRYTRALYGSTAEWRVETSDRPVFATYKKNQTGNIRFRISDGRQTMWLDEAEYCKASYEAGRRDYLLKDRRWGKGELDISVLAFPDTEGAVWRFTVSGFDNRKLKVEAVLSQTVVPKPVRSGDIGSFLKPGTFEPATSETSVLGSVSRLSPGSIFYFSVDGENQLSTAENAKMQSRYDAAEQWRNKLASSVVFHTPDAYINPIGGALVMAADGAWDGKVWQHGAVGWRMSLPGWRGAYMGDFLGMQDRQRIHFDAYAKSQVTDVPVTEPHLMDEKNNLARGTYKWGTPMYSNGYICRNPEKNNQFHHYDMNLVYIDELLWHFQFDADTAYMRKMWPVIKSHLAWEKQAWDPDNDGLYDAYCCIWASDALQYNSGAVTHSSAYNYRANLLAARIAGIIGENPGPYREEADRILKAMNERLWLKDAGHWAEYQDFMGLKRVHWDAALWSIYTPIDCGAGTPEQNYWATRYIDRHIPHIPYIYNNVEYQTLSTSDWAPYEWSINNVAMAEVMHTVLAYYQAGRTEEAYQLLKANILDFMYLGSSPANFGQLSQLDVATGEGYRDFADVTGISSRALIQGLYGITPNALEGECVLRPGFPAAWDSASVHTPYLDYSFKRVNGKDVFDVIQNFKRPLKLVIRQNLGGGKYKDTAFSTDKVQHIEMPTILPKEERDMKDEKDMVGKYPLAESIAEQAVDAWASIKGVGNDFAEVNPKECREVNMDKAFNANVSDIFKNQYLSPRSPYTTLCVPTQGIGDWCSTKKTANIDDTKFRSLIRDGVFMAKIDGDLPFRSPKEGKNIAYTSLWDKYPDSISVMLKGKASHAYLLLAGSTNPMQYAIENAVVRVEYADGTSDELMLTPPVNWCPIEQDFLENATAFPQPQLRPYRIGLASGKVSRHLFRDLHLEVNRNMADVPGFKKAVAEIDGGAAILLDMPLDGKKKLRHLTLRTLSNEVVVGLMGITLQK
jgi:hypothetical protein